MQGSQSEAMEDSYRGFFKFFFYYKSLYYTAQYECIKYPVTIEVIDVYDKPLNREYELNYGDNANNYNVSNISRRYDIIGWDFDNDGVADYSDSSEFPIVTAPQTIKAIFTNRLIDVTIFDVYGKEHIEKGKAYQKNDLNTFDEINNPSCPIDNNITFDHYEYSYDNKVYYKVFDNSIYSVDGMYIKPIYTF